MNLLAVFIGGIVGCLLIGKGFSRGGVLIDLLKNALPCLQNTVNLVMPGVFSVLITAVSGKTLPKTVLGADWENT